MMNKELKKNVYILGGFVAFVFCMFLLGVTAGCGVDFHVDFRPPPEATPTPALEPTPEPTAEPTPEPTEEPTPEPTPTALPGPSPSETPSALCVLPPSLESEETVCMDKPDNPSFLPQLHEAQRLAAGNGFVIDGLVPNDKAYVDEVARLLRGMGLCAINGSEAGHTSEDEVWVKSSNAESQNYDIVTSWGAPNDLYAWKCNPAAF